MNQDIFFGQDNNIYQKRLQSEKQVLKRISRIKQILPILNHAPEIAAGILVYFFSFNYDRAFTEEQQKNYVEECRDDDYVAIIYFSLILVLFIADIFYYLKDDKSFKNGKFYLELGLVLYGFWEGFISDCSKLSPSLFYIKAVNSSRLISQFIEELCEQLLELSEENDDIDSDENESEVSRNELEKSNIEKAEAPLQTEEVLIDGKQKVTRKQVKKVIEFYLEMFDNFLQFPLFLYAVGRELNEDDYNEGKQCNYGCMVLCKKFQQLQVVEIIFLLLALMFMILGLSIVIGASIDSQIKKDQKFLKLSPNDVNQKNKLTNKLKLQFLECIKNMLTNQDSIFIYIVSIVAGIGIFAAMFITIYYFWDCRYIPLYAFVVYWIILTIIIMMAYGLILTLIKLISSKVKQEQKLTSKKSQDYQQKMFY